MEFIEQILAFIGSFADTLVEALPVGYAFGAGMVATVNPCGFVLLPAYISLFLGDPGRGTAELGLPTRLLKGVLVSLAVTLGFVLLFGLVGIGISSGGYFLVTVMPWAGLVIGVVMLALGVWILSGKGHLYLSAPARWSARINPGANSNVTSYFLFGIAYGIASLSCTLPVFLIVVASSLTAASFLDGTLRFVSYSLGMGATLLVLTLGAAVFKGAVAGHMRRVLPYVERASAGLVTLAGAFIIYYWLTIGGLGRSIQGFF